MFCNFNIFFLSHFNFTFQRQKLSINQKLNLLLNFFLLSSPLLPPFTLRKHFNMLPTYMQHVDTLVSELGVLIPELNNVSNRSKAMLTCYPGHGARYVKHTDNHCRLGKGGHCNGRRLTTLIYLNEGWEKKDGGQKI